MELLLVYEMLVLLIGELCDSVACPRALPRGRFASIRAGAHASETRRETARGSLNSISAHADMRI
eukprot:6360173-Pyramimonas_sp.AAC.1